MKRIICFNNKVKVYLDTNGTEEDIESVINSITNKPITYQITLPNGKEYIGHTTDTGERIITHAKCARNVDKRFYTDIRKCGSYTFKVLGIHETQEQARKEESKLIQNTGIGFLKEKYGKQLALIDDDERKAFLSTKMYNKLK